MDLQHGDVAEEIKHLQHCINDLVSVLALPAMWSGNEPSQVVDTLFAAVIAHEINQPLAAVVTNAQACLRWLAAQPPAIAKAMEAAERIVRDGKEAGEVVRCIRALFKQAALKKIELDLNEVTSEVLHLLTGETARKRVAVETDLRPDLAPVAGDCGTGLKDPDRILEAFFTTKENGMGLAICRSIIDAHKGRLWAASGEDSGTIFSFRIPVQAAVAS